MKSGKNAICLAAILLLTIASHVYADFHGLSPEVKKVLKKKVALLDKELSTDFIIIESVRKANLENKKISLDEIMDSDTEWRDSGLLNDFVKGFLINECAEKLVEFQDKYDGFPEIFITDKRGLIVGTTNKTTDYYQADEDWWQKTFDEGTGLSHYGEIEYDQSAMSEAIPVYLPIRETGTNAAIGVMKAVIDVISIKMEL